MLWHEQSEVTHMSIRAQVDFCQLLRGWSRNHESFTEIGTRGSK